MICPEFDWESATAGFIFGWSMGGTILLLLFKEKK